MGKIFYADNAKYTSEQLLRHLLRCHYGIENAEIARTENGKPYLTNTQTPTFFSISHTKKSIFVLFSEKEIGLDAELLDRDRKYASICAKFPKAEREAIDCAQTFLKHWVARESAVKYLGGTLARDLKKLSYVDRLLSYDGQPMPVELRFFEFDGHILCVCSEIPFQNVEFVEVTV